MKKILILAYDFPPYHSIGAQRPYSWFKYFKELDLDPVVITRHWDAIKNEFDYYRSTENQEEIRENNEFGELIRTKYKSNIRDKIFIRYGYHKRNTLRKILTLIYSLGEFYSDLFDSRKELYKSAKNYLSENKCDLIIATGEPFILFKYAYKLSKKHNIPWLADYRDGWSTNYSNFFFKRLNSFQNKIYLKKEKKYLSNAIGINTVSAHMQKVLSDYFDKPVSITYNGYDEDIFKNYSTKAQKDYFKITYLGTIYPYQKLELFLNGFKEFLERHENPTVKLYFYGIESYEKQLRRLQSFSETISKKYLNTTHRIPYESVINEARDSHLLLLLASKGIDGSAAKLYDYLALNKKILLVENDKGTLEKIIIDTNSGSLCESKDEVTQYLDDYYQEWLKTGTVKSKTNNIDQFCRKNQTKQFAKTINNILN